MTTLLNVDFTSSLNPTISEIPHSVPQLFLSDMQPFSSANRYLRNCSRRMLPKSLNTLAEHLKELSSWLEGSGLDVEDMTEVYFDAYVDALCTYRRRTGCPLSWNTVNARVGGAYRFLRWALKNGHCADLKDSDVENSYRSSRKKYLMRGHPAKKLEEPVRFLQLSEAIKFVEYLADCDSTVDAGIRFRNKLMASLMLQVGLRVSEVINFPLKDLPEVNARGYFTPARVVGKGMKARCVLIPNSLLLKLWEYVDFTREKICESVLVRPDSVGFLFLSIEGNAVTRNWMEKQFALISKRLGIKSTPHSLRHTFGTYHYLLNKDLPSLANLMGHASENTTRRFYVHTAMLVSYAGTYSAFQAEIDRLIGGSGFVG
ncbi:site-specific integrase [Pseudomonas sp. NyZ480]|uniref:tyrosine-type recombinase/integrase n=1 Tax=Pseudomonas sp. NyZ480 TaxID=3035289 RepID=UPI00240A30F3|nr:site-specific integrase [Pseudomonas sp. NyZ480]WEZ88849.1 site-specific integrase [Pseudomonas sp. NyZ480]